MSRHYKPGDSEDFDFVRSVIDAVRSGNPLDRSMSEAHDDPSEHIEESDAPEDGDDGRGMR